MMKDWLHSMRPKHWVKNGFCLAALIFSGQANDLYRWLELGPLFVSFCLLSSAGYLLNDALNVDEDRKHPRKKNRPLAAGRLSKRSVVSVGGGLVVLALAVLFVLFGGKEGLVGWTPWVGLAYYLFTASYSFFIRGIPLFDVLFLGLGFVLRVVAGAFVLNLEPTIWLLSCTYAIVLLIGFGKRQGELRVLGHGGQELGDTRKALRSYTPGLLNALTGFCGLMAGALYFAYCMSRPDRVPFVFTGIPVLVGLISYMRLVCRSEQVDAPEELLLKSPVLLLAVISWVSLIIFFSV